MDAVKVKTDVCYFSLQQHSETKSKLLFFSCLCLKEL